MNPSKPWRRLRHLLGGLMLLVSLSAAGNPLILDADTRSVDAWPHLTVLADPTRALSLARVLAQRAEFAPPTGPHANLGRRPEAMWLHLVLEPSATAPRRWVLSVDYASIERIDLYVVHPGAEPQVIVLGRSLPFSQHPLPSAGHAAALELEPGQAHELLMRVETRSTMLLPITLASAEAFHASEARTQVLQGLLAGAVLCLLLYSLTQWVSLRDSAFLSYALTLFGTAIFFVAYFGLGPQHLWGESAWLTEHAAPLAVLVALAGGCLFIGRTLEIGALHPWIGRALRAEALLATVVAAAFALDVLGYRSTQLTASVLGPLPMLLAVPAAFQRARRGERVGVYMLIGWSAYGIATLTMAALLAGRVPSNFWTQHAFQFGAIFEMVLWMRVLGVRIEMLRASAQRAHLERDALRSLAHTDALTGLPNRRGLNDVLQHVLPAAAPERLVAVYLLDLDGFKPINDRLGHEAGDELLVQVARRLQSLLRASDSVARLGGDEFVVVAAGLPRDAEAQALGRKLLDGFQRPFPVAGQECRVGLTIGYALSPHDGRDAIGLLKRADAAMYAGKQAGRNCLRRGGASVSLAAA